MHIAKIFAFHRRDRNESPGLSDLIMEGDADQDAQRAGAELARAFDQGQGLEAALQAAADADARKADEALKAERRRSAPATTPPDFRAPFCCTYLITSVLSLDTGLRVVAIIK